MLRSRKALPFFVKGNVPQGLTLRAILVSPLETLKSISTVVARALKGGFPVRIIAFPNKCPLSGKQLSSTQ